MTKRANGEGSIGKRKDGRWGSAVSYTDESGLRRRQRFYGATQAEVRGKLDEARRRLSDGDPVKDASSTVGSFVTSWIEAALAASPRKASTKENYATIAKVHLVPGTFGDLTLELLRPSDVEGLLMAKRRSGLSASTVRTIYTVLRSALDVAVRDGLLRRNVAASIPRPGIERTEARHLDREQVTELLAAATGTRQHALLVFMVGTWVRRGEALAVHWKDVDLDARTARIRLTLARVGGSLAMTEPKTEKSRRTVPLPRFVVEELREHRVAQAADRLRLGPAWGDQDMVFPNEIGAPWEPRNVARRFQALADSQHLVGVSLHTLRHTTATALLEAGTSMRVVQELLGHSSYAITADVYSHVGAGQQREAADRLQEVFS
jgi:integrase